MSTPEPKVTKSGDPYSVALAEDLFGGGEGSLERAYELGRQALANGVSILDLVLVHHQALAAILHETSPSEAAQIVNRSSGFLAESLTAYEMTHRGFRETLAELRASEARYRELFENANDMVFTLDLSGQFTTLNRAAERLVDRSQESDRVLNIADLVAPEYLNLVKRALESKLAGGHPTVYELEIITRDGKRLPVEVSTRLIQHEGKAIGFHGIARDITERKRAEEALRRLNTAMEDEAKRIAHALHDEASQLLAAVHITVDEMGREIPDPARQHLQKVKSLLDQIEDQLRGLAHELRPTVLDDSGLIPALEFLAGRVSKRSKINITVDGPKDMRLPSTIETGIYRIVQEALNNAAKHGSATHVRIRVSCTNGSAHCSVHDNGKGFDPMSVLSGENKRGLGLLGIRERLTSFGGSLQIRSAPGKGTDLEISIPIGR